MKHETDTLVADLKHDPAERFESTPMRRDGTATPATSALRNSTEQHATPSTKRTLGDRFKGFLSNLAEALEGDHEFHKYLGG
jgi:hypothetical protein